jgi:protein required for attachment to host cells
MKHARIWYVIADGGRARFVERDEAGAYRTVVSFDSADRHERSHDLGRDRPARVKESANSARHAVEPRRDLHEAAKEDFIALVAAEIEAEHGRDQFDRLVLIAPPGVLTELKQKLSRPLVQIVASDLQKDLTKVPDHDLGQHILPAR